MTRDEQDELIAMAVKTHYDRARFRIDISNSGLKKLNEWLEDNDITEYQIIELYAYIAFNNNKDAVAFRLTHNNELLD